MSNLPKSLKFIRGSEIRRASKVPSDFGQLTELLESLYATSAFQITYQPPNGQTIVIASSEDLINAYQVSQGQPCVKLDLTPLERKSSLLLSRLSTLKESIYASLAGESDQDSRLRTQTLLAIGNPFHSSRSVNSDQQNEKSFEEVKVNSSEQNTNLKQDLVEFPRQVQGLSGLEAKQVEEQPILQDGLQFQFQQQAIQKQTVDIEQMQKQIVDIQQMQKQAVDIELMQQAVSGDSSPIENKKVVFKVVSSQSEDISECEAQEPDKPQILQKDEQTPVQNGLTAPALVVHYDCACQFCGQSPILGTRFKCSVCPNLNLCESCEKNIPHNHALLQYRAPEPVVHQDLSYLLSKQGFQGLLNLFKGQKSKKKLAVKVKHTNYMDNTNVRANTTITKEWKLKNTGKYVWPKGTILVQVVGSSQYLEIDLPSLAPGEKCPVNLTLNIGPTPGRLQNQWKLQTPQGKRFGSLLLDINVIDERVYELSRLGFSISDAKVALETTNGDLVEALNELLQKLGSQQDHNNFQQMFDYIGDMYPWRASRQPCNSQSSRGTTFKIAFARSIDKRLLFIYRALLQIFCAAQDFWGIQQRVLLKLLGSGSGEDICRVPLSTVLFRICFAGLVNAAVRPISQGVLYLGGRKGVWEGNSGNSYQETSMLVDRYLLVLFFIRKHMIKQLT